MLFWSLLGSLLTACACARMMPTQPHLIFILVDDLGWDDVSFHGSDQILTPNIDALAHNGIILNNYYVQPICSPSRASLMTGRYCIHTGMQHQVLMAAQPYGLGLNETLLPQYLKRLGYATHIVGKWHLGFFHKEYTPTYRGFDSHYGYWLGAEDYYTHVQKEGKYSGYDFRRNMNFDNSSFGKYSTELYTDEALRVINKHNQTKPLFLYLPYQSVHVPIEAPAEYVRRFPHIKNKKRRVYAGMLAALDDSIGRIIQQLHINGMWENSVIILSTDNGGPTPNYSPGSNFPLRGGKYSLWEGGVKGTGLVYSPMLKNSQRVSNQMMHLVDWLPTLVHLAGGDTKNLTQLDGFNMWETLSKDLPSPRTEILHNIDNAEGYAVRVGDYKIVHFKCCDIGYSFNGWYPTPQARRNGSWAERTVNGLHSMSEYDAYEEKDTVAVEYVDNAGTFHMGKEREVDSNSLSQWQHYFKSENARKSSIKHILHSPKKISVKRLVECGPVPSNATTSCNVNEETCLFNIRDDPCEYYNLAKRRPDILKMLLNKMRAYNATAVPIRNKPATPDANPDLYGGIWTNYGDKKTVR